MRKYSDTKYNKIISALLVITIAISIILAIIRSQLSAHISQICEYKSKETANSIITTAINKELQGSSDESYINIQRNNDNEIISIETNSEKINKLQSDLKTKINSKLKNLSNECVYIPIGTLSGITFLSGRGPDMNLKLHQIGGIETEIVSEFSSAGINQTRHRLLLKVSIELTAIIPFHSTDISVTDDYVISETIIVGEIPKGYIGTNT